MNFCYGNIAIIFILLIILVVVFQLVSTQIVIEGARIKNRITGQKIYETFDTKIEGLTANEGIYNLNNWTELENMKKVCELHNYFVDKWDDHIRLLIKDISVPFQTKKFNQQNWTTYQYDIYQKKIIEYPCKVNESYWVGCGFRNRYKCYKTRQKNSTCKNNSYELVQKEFILSENNEGYEFKFEGYDKFISDLVKNNIKNDKDLSKTDILNDSNFTTMEGFEYAGDKDKIKLSNDKFVVNDKIIDTILSENSYEVESTDLHNFIKKFTKSGNTLSDMRRYIKTMQNFGINDETVAKEFTQTIYDKLNPQKRTYVDVETLMNTYLPKYGLKSVIDFVDKHDNGPFSQIIISNDIHNLSIPLFPTTQDSTNCVMEKMTMISGVNIPTTGMDGQLYNIDEFFRAFRTHGVSAQDFFNRIYETYSTLNIKSSPEKIKPTLQTYILSIKPDNLINSFDELKIRLNPNNLNMSFNEYIRLIVILKRRVSFNKNQIVDIWNSFKTYYKTYDSSTTDNKITSETLEKWFSEIETFYTENSPLKSESSTFFTINGGDFLTFVKNVLISGSYNMSDIKRDITIGLSYSKLISTYNNNATSQQKTNKSPFTSMNPIIKSNPLEYLYELILIGVRELFGDLYEGAETMDSSKLSQSDINTLNSFEITSFSDGTLRTLEMQLINADIKNIDPNKTIWNNMMTFVGAMVKIQITNSNFTQFIELMKNFKANTIKDWFIVLDKLTPISIKKFSGVETFISKITEFGIYYTSHFELFLDKLNNFGANFAATGLQPLVTFLNDMKAVGFTYSTPSGVQSVNNIIDFFSNNKISLNGYSSNSRITIPTCNASLPAEFGHKLVMALYEYKTANYSNQLYDIQTPNLFNSAPLCDRIAAMQQAYMLCKHLNNNNDIPSVIIPNMTLIISFFYKEELDAFLGNNGYADISKRVSMMQDVGSAIARYANEFKNDHPREFDLYTSISTVFKTFPALTFQYISEDIMSKCGNGNCTYNQYVDCKYSFCKACSTNQTTNYRSLPPVI